MKWPIVRKDQLDSHEIFIDATLDPSCSLPSTFFDGRHTLHVRHTTFLACAHVYVECKSTPTNIPLKVIAV